MDLEGVGSGSSSADPMDSNWRREGYVLEAKAWCYGMTASLDVHIIFSPENTISEASQVFIPPISRTTRRLFWGRCWLSWLCASMGTKEESDEIQRIAKETIPGTKTMALPHGLQVEKRLHAVVEFLKKKWPG
jgi:hypothetical protein